MKSLSHVTFVFLDYYSYLIKCVQAILEKSKLDESKQVARWSFCSWDLHVGNREILFRSHFNGQGFEKVGVEVLSAISGRAINDWAVRTEHLLAKWQAYRGKSLNPVCILSAKALMLQSPAPRFKRTFKNTETDSRSENLTDISIKFFFVNWK